MLVNMVKINVDSKWDMIYVNTLLTVLLFDGDQMT